MSKALEMSRKTATECLPGILPVMMLSSFGSTIGGPFRTESMLHWGE